MRHRDLDNPDMPLSEVLDRWPAVIPVFLRHRMICVGCLIRPFHTITDACEEYGLDETEFRAELREAISRASAGTG